MHPGADPSAEIDLDAVEQDLADVETALGHMDDDTHGPDHPPPDASADHQAVAARKER